MHHALLVDADELITLMLASSVARTGYGIAGVAFDFASIEEALAARLLTGSRHIDCSALGPIGKEAPSIFLFKGELLPRHRDLHSQVSEQITQEPVANARALREEPYLQEPKFCREALELLELVLYNATKSLPGPDERLRSYCEAFDLVGAEDSLRSRVLQCKAIGEVPLKQLRSLHELIEALVADAVLPTLPHRFRVPLPSVAMADRACLELGKNAVVRGAASEPVAEAAALRAGQARLEPALKRFIYRELKASAIMSDVELDTPLYHSIRWRPDFPWSMGDGVTDEEVDAAFPDDEDPALKHAYALWVELRRRGGEADGEWVGVLL